ncbi:cupin-like domain-containing protein [Phlyctochytrium arcticum]|nr:cupin-like domain-containing protein [Phlyctochytrium arcticum]
MTIAPDNQYKGFHPASGSWSLDRVDPSSITAKSFFEKYVGPRKPCILTGLLPDKTWKGAPWKDLEYLSKAAGEATVQVEKKNPDTQTFGTGLPREEMSFKSFLENLKKGNTELYLTTQYQPEEIDEEEESDEDAEEDLLDDAEEEKKYMEIARKRFLSDFCPPPCHLLLKDFPLQPELLKGLVPQTVNLWIGASKAGAPEGSSSGLHHDFQDNLYVLIRGQKKFRIFSPKDAENLYVNGQINKVYPNGYIEYSSSDDDEDTKMREDGANLFDVASWRVSNAQDALDKAEDSGKGVAEAEKALAEAIENLSKVGHLEDGDIDFDELDEDEDDEDDEEDNNSVDGEPASKEKSINKRSAEEDEDESANGTSAENGEKEGERSAKKAKFEDDTEDDELPEPASFSRIPSAVLHGKGDAKDFPLLAKSTGIDFTLKESEMLYLPAGWFHEVQSSGTSSAEQDANIHIAFNYWFAPPVTNKFAQPYEDKYWSDWFNGVSESIKQV